MELARSQQIQLPNASYNIERLVNLLTTKKQQMQVHHRLPASTESISTEEIKMEVITQALKNGFMPRLRGKAREYCSIGHKMELPIACTFMSDVNDHNLVPNLQVMSFHSAGLVSRKGAPWVKDSIDLI